LRLAGEVPVEICGDEDNWEETAEQLDDIFLGDAEIRRRSTHEGAGPRGDLPVVTSDGHMILDIQFYEGIKLFGEDADYERIAEEIEAVDGVVAHGLVVEGSQKRDLILVACGVGRELVRLSGKDCIEAISGVVNDNEL